MAVIIPQVVTASRATGAQVIDGSLKFDSSKKNYLTRTPGSAGNNKTFTFSTWTKGLGDGTFFCNGGFYWRQRTLYYDYFWQFLCWHMDY